MKTCLKLLIVALYLVLFNSAGFGQVYVPFDFCTMSPSDTNYNVRYKRVHVTYNSSSCGINVSGTFRPKDCPNNIQSWCGKVIQYDETRSCDGVQIHVKDGGVVDALASIHQMAVYQCGTSGGSYLSYGGSSFEAHLLNAWR